MLNDMILTAIARKVKKNILLYNTFIKIVQIRYFTCNILAE